MTPAGYALLVAAACLAAVFLAGWAFGRRWAFLALFCAVLIGFAAMQAETLGRAKPAALEWRAVEAAQVLHHARSGDGVVAVLMIAGAPRCYRFPGEDAARQFRRAGEKHGDDGMAIERPFEWRSHGDRMRYEFRGLRAEPPEKIR